MKHLNRGDRTRALWALLVFIFALCGPAFATTSADSALATRLEKGGLSAAQAQRLTSAIAEAQRAGSPVDSVLSRIDEGLAKQVSPDAMERAVQLRLKSLQSAHAIVSAAGYSDFSFEPSRQLLTATVLASESGVPIDDLRSVIARGQGRFAMRMASVIGAGESLHLAGFERETVQSIMSDCIDRNLGRMEILRVVSHCVQQHRAGMSDSAIRANLWSASSTTNGLRRGQGPGGSGAH